MISRLFSRLPHVLLAILVSVIAAGCSAEEVAVTSPWPVAQAERVIDKPAPPPIWPLTGLAASDSALPTARRIVSVKVENSPAARPQSGLQLADVVYESITEGGITRFNCMFHSQIPETVGPVRSARFSDVKLVPQYAPLFAFSGANSRVNAAIRSAGLQNLSQDAGISNGYSRVRSRPAPHNLYLDLGKIREEGVKRGFPATQELRRLNFERGVSNPGALPAAGISIPFSTANRVEWTYDAAADAYVRANNGSVHKDALTGEQLRATNVVVMWAKATPTQPAGTYDIALTGSNRVSVFRNGQRIDGTWNAAADSPPTFSAADGSPVRLSPGNTWFQVVSTEVNITVR
ncbi:MAG: DUF3048 domain-containing protein [Coriobacteriia bacterium]|nr:DUF3048 domain-containing protein [Coriobacteriia bacterium]